VVVGVGGVGLAVVVSFVGRRGGLVGGVVVLRNGRNGGKVVKSDRLDEGGLFPTYREEFELMWAVSRPVS
jgi:hypothetical protein